MVPEPENGPKMARFRDDNTFSELPKNDRKRHEIAAVATQKRHVHLDISRVKHTHLSARERVKRPTPR